jgi:hypothetical protein
MWIYLLIFSAQSCYHVDNKIWFVSISHTVGKPRCKESRKKPGWFAPPTITLVTDFVWSVVHKSLPVRRWPWTRPLYGLPHLMLADVAHILVSWALCVYDGFFYTKFIVKVGRIYVSIRFAFWAIVCVFFFVSAALKMWNMQLFFIIVSSAVVMILFTIIKIFALITAFMEEFIIFTLSCTPLVICKYYQSKPVSCHPVIPCNVNLKRLIQIQFIFIKFALLYFHFDRKGSSCTLHFG